MRIAAIVVLVGGLIAAGAVHVGASDDASSGGDFRVVGGQAFAVDDSAASERQSARLGGEALVRAAAFDRWLRSLWHGERLAWTLGLGAVAVAAFLRHLAALADETGDERVER